MISSPPKRTPSFGRFANQNKKDLQVRSTPLRKKEKNLISTPPPLWIVTKNEPTSIYVKIVVRECMGGKGQMAHKMSKK